MKSIRFIKHLLAPAWVALAFTMPAQAAMLPPEKLLPADTLLVVTVPDFAKAREVFRASPTCQLWRDPAMKPFRDDFMENFKSEVVTPLERELGIRFEDYAGLAQGQLTFALTLNGWNGENDAKPAAVLLVDARDKSEQLKTNLSGIKQRWVDAGKTLRTEKIRDVEFSVLITTGDEISKTLDKALPGFGANQPELDEEEDAEGSDEEKSGKKKEIYVGQVESLLILGNEAAVIEKILIRMSGGLVPALAEQAAFEANHTAMFRDAPLYGWLNAKALVDALNRRAAIKSEGQQASLIPVRMDKVFAATGLTGLKTVGFSYRVSNDGSLVHVLLGAPETGRQGLFKILAADAKDANAPLFVPADVVKFQRYRIDVQQAWNTLEKMFNEISPQMFGGIKFLLDTAEAAAKEKDPGFDLRKNLIGNLGDDMISYDKSPRGTSPAELQSPPSLFLISSPNPDQLVSAMKSVLAIISSSGSAPTEREFLGRTIHTFPSPALPTASLGGGKPQSLNMVASGGYVAFSKDAAILEEYLRSSEAQGKSLRETPGLLEAAQKIGGTGTGMFGYANQTETMKMTFDALKRNAADESDSLAGFGALPPGFDATEIMQEWADFSLLPEFSKIAKYFSFSVHAWNATPDGLHIKVFSPTPPGLKQ